MKKQVPLQIFFTFVMFLFLICTATWLVLACTPIYYAFIDIFDIENFSGYSRDLIVRNYNVLIEYNMFWGAPKLVFPDLAMSASGEKHFAEVKNIFVLMQYTAMGTLALLIPIMRYSTKKNLHNWYKWVIYAAIVVLAVVGGAIAIDWEGTFVLFHQIVFNNNDWLFDPAFDPVIMILPDEVFLTDAALIMGLIVAGLVGCGLTYRKKKKK